MKAAAAPWTTRIVIIQAMVCAAPARAVATANTAAPDTNVRRRPSRSPNRPPSTIRAASGRMFAVRIHWPLLRLPCRPSTTSGDASGTAVWSTRIMLLASVIAVRVNHIARVVGSVANPDIGEGYRRPLVFSRQQNFGLAAACRSPHQRAACCCVMEPTSSVRVVHAPAPEATRVEDQAGTERPCSQACQAGSSRRT